MPSVSAKNGNFTLRAYRGDAKTLLAFNLTDKSGIKNLAGFTIQCQPKGQPAYFIQNNLRFEKPAEHTQDPKQSANSSINAPIHKFRWMHVPGSVHQGLKPFLGDYTYTVTPRYFDDKSSMLPLDSKLSASVTITVDAFMKGNLALGFTRGFTQSQAFVHHFGRSALIKPKDAKAAVRHLQGVGQERRGRDLHVCRGIRVARLHRARAIFELLNEVLTEQDAWARRVRLRSQRARPDRRAAQARQAGPRARSSSTTRRCTTTSTKPTSPKTSSRSCSARPPEEEAAILRGKFGRFAHDKVFIVSKKARRRHGGQGADRLDELLGHRLYVNSNHVLVFDDAQVAGNYAERVRGIVERWREDGGVRARRTGAAQDLFARAQADTSDRDHLLAARRNDMAVKMLGRRSSSGSSRKARRGAKGGSVLFAVMADRQGHEPGLHGAQHAACRPVDLQLRHLRQPGRHLAVSPRQEDRRARDRQAGQHRTAAALQSGARHRAWASDPPQVRGLRIQRRRPGRLSAAPRISRPAARR